MKQTNTKKRGGRGWGGAWRAFVRLRSLGRSGTPDLKALGVAYSEFKEEGGVSFRHIQRSGAAATTTGRHRPLRHGQSAFGHTGRTEARQKVKDLRRMLCEGAKAADKEDHTLQVVGRLSMGGVSVASCLSLARSAMRAQSARERVKEREVDRILEDFCNGPGAEQLQRVVQELPELASLGLTPAPSAFGIAFHAAGPSADNLAKAVAWASASKSSNVAQTLDRWWSRAHETLQQEDCEPTAHLPDPGTDCLRAGRCICSFDGQRLRLFRNRLIRAMKAACPAGSDQRVLLVDGRVVAHIVGGMMPAANVGKADFSSPSVDLWLHVGLMYLSPYRPTFMRVEPVGDLGECVSHPSRVYVKASIETTGKSCFYEDCAPPHPRCRPQTSLCNCPAKSATLLARSGVSQPLRESAILKFP